MWQLGSRLEENPSGKEYRTDASSPPITGVLIMSKERSNAREAKKKPAKSLTEKRAEKRAKKEGKAFEAR